MAAPPTKPLSLPMLPQGIAGPQLQTLVLQINDRLRRINTGVFTTVTATPGTGGGGAGGGGGMGPPPATVTAFWQGVPTGTLNGSNVTFTLPGVPVTDSLLFSINGIGQTPGIDYTLSGSTITCTVAPIATDQLFAFYSTMAMGFWQGTPSGTQNGVNPTFTLPSAPMTDSLLFWINGLFQTPGIDYTLTGSTITCTVPPISTDQLFGWFAA